jgi:hypothetical protein
VATATAATATAFVGAMTVRTSVRDAGKINAVNDRNARTVKTVKTVTRAPSAHQESKGESKGRRAASVPRGRIAHLGNGPNRGNSVHRSLDARPLPVRARLNRAKAITNASAAVAAAATAAKEVSAMGIHRRHLGARSSESQQVPLRLKDRHRRRPYQSS